MRLIKYYTQSALAEVWALKKKIGTDNWGIWNVDVQKDNKQRSTKTIWAKKRNNENIKEEAVKHLNPNGNREWELADFITNSQSRVWQR